MNTERDLLKAKREAFLAFEREDPQLPEPDRSLALPISHGVGLPVLRGALDAKVVRATIAEHGSVVVKGLLDSRLVATLQVAFEAAFAERDASRAGANPLNAGEWYSEFPMLRFPWHRNLTHDTGGMLAVDSPRALFQCFEALTESGVLRMVNDYHGVRPAFTAEKTVFRRVSNEHAGPPDCGWHQDGSFMRTDRRVLNIWITLTSCGRTAPTLEVLPRRVDRILENEDGHLPGQVLEREYPDVAPVFPQLEPGDAVFFDHMCVHRSGHAPGMTDPRFALECWTFAPDNVPSDYTGLIL